MTLHFPSEEALRVAITSALIPAEVMSSPARGWSDREGALWVSPGKALTKKVLAALEAAGVRKQEASPPASARQASCWAELIPVRRDGGEIGDGEILFLLPDAASLLETAGELVRLGCDRQELRAVGDRFLLRAFSPPYYTLARALDRVGGLRAFAPSPKGQDRVYVEVGYSHPLAAALRPEEGTVLFLPAPLGGQVWTSLPAGTWSEIHALTDLVVPGRILDLVENARPPRLRITVRLSRGGRGDPPTLWILREDAVARVERLLASVPDDVASGLLFAVVGEPAAPTVILRARTGARKTVTIELDAAPFRAHHQIANLFLPCGAILEPPLRRDKVAELLAPDPDQVVWVSPKVGGEAGVEGELRVERLREAAFRPLSDWVEYVVDTSVPALTAWVRSASFDFAELEIDEPLERTRPRREEVLEEPEEEAPREKRTRPATKERTPKTPPKVEKPDLGPVEIVVEERAEKPTLEALTACEKEFLALEAGADDPARVELWGRMGELNHRLGRAKDAALCWTRALWELDGEMAHAMAREWCRAETGGSRGIAPRLALETPTRDDIRAVASALHLEGLAPGGGVDLAGAAVWLDRHDDLLDLRSFWLARAALSRLAGHDALGLARARDRLLVKLHRGLSVERDVPTFLRFMTHGGAREGGHVERLFLQLKELLSRIEKTKRARSSVEAKPELTLAYTHFIVAYGAARLGQTDYARELSARAQSRLDLDEPIHGFLARAYAVRVAQALEGLPPETPLTPEVAARLNALDKLSRYKVDRVRQFSKVLEPQERLDPVVAFQKGDQDPRGPELAKLRGMADPAAIEREIEAIMRQAKQSSVDDRARLYDGVMDFFPMIGSERASRHLEELIDALEGIAPARQAQLLEEAMMLAGHVGHPALGRRIFQRLDPLVAGLSTEQAAEIASEMGGMLRTLRRVGLRTEAAQLLGTMQKAAGGTGTPALIARLHTAAGLSYLGHFEEARPVFEEMLGVLSGEVAMPPRLELTRAVARAVGQTPPEYAVAVLSKLGEKLKVVTDSFNTNSHVCLSVVAFVESLVLGYASEDLAIGELGRQWLDDDEYLIRRRIHRDMGPPR